MRIVRQILDKMPGGDYRIQDKKVTPPPRARIDESMEALIHHFKLFTEGFKVPTGEVYVAVESPRGELGCYLASDGSAKPYRMHMRAPSFVNIQTLPHMMRGRLSPTPWRSSRRSTPSSEMSTDERTGSPSMSANTAAEVVRPDTALGRWAMSRLSVENTVLAREIIGRYPRPKSALIPLLHLSQEQNGYVTNEAMEHIAELTGVTPAEVYGTATFYEMFQLRAGRQVPDQHLHDDVVRAARGRGADAPRRATPRHQGGRHD